MADSTSARPDLEGSWHPDEVQPDFLTGPVHLVPGHSSGRYVLRAYVDGQLATEAGLQAWAAVLGKHSDRAQPWAEIFRAVETADQAGRRPS